MTKTAERRVSVMAKDPKRDARAKHLQLLGTKLQQAGRAAEAHDVLVEAMGLFAPGEETFLAGSIAVDLATSFRDLETGIPRC
jgi:hypothetical protein